MLKANSPGCPCCCDCWLDVSVTSFVADAGTWTRNTSPLNAVTTSSDARLRSSRAWNRWQTIKVTVAHTVAGEWVQVGFAADGTYGDRVYLRARAVSATKTLELEYRETIGGVDALIATQSFTTTYIVPSLATEWWLIYDPDYHTITGLVTWAGLLRNLRAGTTAVGIKYGYVGTETITGTTTVTAARTRHCYSPDGCPGGGTCFTDRAPHEWEIDLSGVALGDQAVICTIPPVMGGGGLGTPVYGYYDWYSSMNAVHVPVSDNGAGSTNWFLQDQYAWTDAGLDCQGPGTGSHLLDVVWRVTAFWAKSFLSLIASCSTYNPADATLNPAYVGKPVLVLTVSFSSAVYTATWAAIVQADWDSDQYYYGDEHVMTPDLFPAVCNFDWRTVNRKRLTFICGSNTGVDFRGSNLYLSAKP